VKLRPQTLLAGLAWAALVPALAWGAAPPPPLTAEDRQEVARIVDYLQGLGSVKSGFVQTNARGASAGGTFYLQLPGRARFEYDPPSGLVMAADGRNMTEVDRRLKTRHVYALASTPLALILERNIRLDRGVVVRQVTHDRGSVTLVVEDARKKARGQVALNFSEAPLSLTGWTLQEGRGGAIKVRLAGLTPSAPHDQSFFELRDPKAD
jgi:outer membrane lipoprotein-sorting protein